VSALDISAVARLNVQGKASPTKTDKWSGLEKDLKNQTGFLIGLEGRLPFQIRRPSQTAERVDRGRGSGYGYS